MSQKNIILSPHLDDAAFSCWHQIEKTNSQVLTIFAGTPVDETPSEWDVLLGQTSAKEAMNLRRHENEEALHTTSTEITNLDFLDSPYRSVAPSIIEIADRIEDNTPSDALVIASAGIGRYRKGHADHILIRKVAQTLIERGRHVVFYADLPYMFPKIFFKNWPSRMFKRKIERELGMKIDIEPFELSPEQQMRKQTACQAYKTQFQAFHAFKKPGAYRWEVIIYPK